MASFNLSGNLSGARLLWFLQLVEKQIVWSWRRGSESNRRIRLLQSPALPLGYPAVESCKIKSVPARRKPRFSCGTFHDLHPPPPVSSNQLGSGDLPIFPMTLVEPLLLSV